jgi:hypothetical protein
MARSVQRLSTMHHFCTPAPACRDLNLDRSFWTKDSSGSWFGGAGKKVLAGGSSFVG